MRIHDNSLFTQSRSKVCRLHTNTTTAVSGESSTTILPVLYYKRARERGGGWLVSFYHSTVVNVMHTLLGMASRCLLEGGREGGGKEGIAFTPIAVKHIVIMDMAAAIVRMQPNRINQTTGRVGINLCDITMYNEECMHVHIRSCITVCNTMVTPTKLQLLLTLSLFLSLSLTCSLPVDPQVFFPR